MYKNIDPRLVEAAYAQQAVHQAADLLIHHGAIAPEFKQGAAFHEAANAASAAIMNQEVAINGEEGERHEEGYVPGEDTFSIAVARLFMDGRGAMAENYSKNEVAELEKQRYVRAVNGAHGATSIAYRSRNNGSSGTITMDTVHESGRNLLGKARVHSVTRTTYSITGTDVLRMQETYKNHDDAASKRGPRSIQMPVPLDEAGLVGLADTLNKMRVDKLWESEKK